MASFVVIALVTVIVGAVAGAFLRLSFAIRHEDRRQTLRFAAPTQSAQAARALVNLTGTRQD
jgi:NADH:ubiquinone oxidoreductase subunit 6 (subunit J)